MITLNDIMNRTQTFAHYHFCGGVDQQAINNAATELGVIFPNQYINYLLRMGSGYVESEEFIGLGGDAHLNVIKLTNQMRCEIDSFPFSYIPLRHDGYGNYDCIDVLRSVNCAYDKCIIVEWLHDNELQEGRVLADSLYSWMNSILDLIA